MNANYSDILSLISEKIRQSRLKIIVQANAGLIGIYWIIGDIIYQQQNENGWGAKTIDNLAQDLKKEFPDLGGFSPRNLRYMRDFAKAWPEWSFLQQDVANLPRILQHPVAKLTWGHNIRLLKIKTREERLFYAEKSLENGWNRDVLVIQIENKLYHRTGKLTHNFTETLPPRDSDLAMELFKEPYHLALAGLTEQAREKDIENALIRNILDLLVEMGRGFAFMGRQVHYEVDGKDYYIDLLFYHTKLHRYIVVELKIGEFKAEYAGKMNLYLSAVDSKEMILGDSPSIGLILCKSKSAVTAEYALRDFNKPIGIAEWTFTRELPAALKDELPTIEDLEMALQKEDSPADPFYEKLGTIKELLSKLKKKEVTVQKNKEGVLQAFEIALQLQRRVTEQLKDVIPLFLDYWIAPTVNTGAVRNTTPDKIKETLSENTQSVGIYICLEAMKGAGERNFDVHDNLNISLEKNKAGIVNTGHIFWSEKAYNDLWQEDEVYEIAKRFSMVLLTRIEEEIKRIS